jgi:hypothetical protein
MGATNRGVDGHEPGTSEHYFITIVPRSMFIPQTN